MGLRLMPVLVLAWCHPALPACIIAYCTHACIGLSGAGLNYSKILAHNTGTMTG
jgi:hypothetical protein